jgi:hypothetical protein
MQKVQRLWGQPTVAWISSDRASLGGRYIGPWNRIGRPLQGGVSFQLLAVA